MTFQSNDGPAVTSNVSAQWHAAATGPGKPLAVLVSSNRTLRCWQPSRKLDCADNKL